jgi:protein TonB
MLLTPIQPVYPAIARQAGVQGAVVMEAIISKAGSIESLHAVSGPQMLRAAALSAVEAARYRPYRLNGEPTEVQTTITIVFQLSR